MAYQAGFDLSIEDREFSTDTKTLAGYSSILQHVLILIYTVIYSLGKALHSLLQLHISYTNNMLVTPLSDIFDMHVVWGTGSKYPKRRVK